MTTEALAGQEDSFRWPTERGERWPAGALAKRAELFLGASDSVAVMR